MTDQRLLTPAQIAEHLQLNEATVTQWLREGRLRGFKIGKKWRVSLQDLSDFVESGANKPSKGSISAA